MTTGNNHLLSHLGRLQLGRSSVLPGVTNAAAGIWGPAGARWPKIVSLTCMAASGAPLKASQFPSAWLSQEGSQDSHDSLAILRGGEQKQASSGPTLEVTYVRTFTSSWSRQVTSPA